MTSILQRIATFAAALSITAGLLVVQASAPAPRQDARPIENLETVRCVDDSFEFGLRALECNGAPYQDWIRLGNAAAWQNVATGRCLDDSPEFGLRPFDCNGLSYQEWYGTSEQRNEATGRCLDDHVDFGLRAIECNGSDHQQWLFHS
jgi:hypothetical protein